MVTDIHLQPLAKTEMMLSASDVVDQQRDEDEKVDEFNEGSDKDPSIELALATSLRRDWAEVAGGMWRDLMPHDDLHGLSEQQLANWENVPHCECTGALHMFMRITSVTTVLWTTNSRYRDKWSRQVVEVLTSANESLVKWCERQASFQAAEYMQSHPAFHSWMMAQLTDGTAVDLQNMIDEVCGMAVDLHGARARLIILRASVWS